jgi:hypothetical protein
LNAPVKVGTKNEIGAAAHQGPRLHVARNYNL